MTDLDTLDALREAMLASEDAPVLVFKHSATCPVSSLAHAQMSLLGPDDVPMYRIVVQRARAVSDAFADQTGVRHESPQALLVAGGAVVWHASHFRVTAGAVRDAVARTLHR